MTYQDTYIAFLIYQLTHISKFPPHKSVFSPMYVPSAFTKPGTFGRGLLELLSFLEGLTVTVSAEVGSGTPPATSNLMESTRLTLPLRLILDFYTWYICTWLRVSPAWLFAVKALLAGGIHESASSQEGTFKSRGIVWIKFAFRRAETAEGTFLQTCELLKGQNVPQTGPCNWHGVISTMPVGWLYEVSLPGSEHESTETAPCVTRAKLKIEMERIVRFIALVKISLFFQNYPLSLDLRYLIPSWNMFFKRPSKYFKRETIVVQPYALGFEACANIIQIFLLNFQIIKSFTVNEV